MPTTSPIADTYGVLYLTVIFGAILYGILIMQIYIYAFRFKEDKLMIKIFVSCITLLDSLHQALLTYDLWSILIDDFEEPLHLLSIDWSYQAILVTSYMMSYLVQLFYTYRIWSLARNVLLCGLIILFGFLYVSFGVYFEIGVAKVPVWSVTSRTTSDNWPMIAALSCSIVTDGLIAASIGFMLQRKLAEFERTRSIMHKLINYTIGTGCLLATVSLMALIAISGSFYYSFAFFQICFMLLPKLYTNSMMISLNARKGMRGNLSQFCNLNGHLPSNSVELSGFCAQQSKYQCPPGLVTDARKSLATYDRNELH